MFTDDSEYKSDVTSEQGKQCFEFQKGIFWPMLYLNPLHNIVLRNRKNKKSCASVYRNSYAIKCLLF